MNTLSICTASSATLIAIEYNGEKITKTLAFSRHSENLFPLLIELLDSHNLSLNNFDCFGCVTGPGSFTGIRIGLSVIKAFAFALDKPIVAINSLELLAYNADILEGRALSIINAGAGLVYYQYFEKKAGALVATTEPKLDKYTHLADRIKADDGADLGIVYSQNNEKGDNYEAIFGRSQEFSLDSLSRAIENKIKNDDFTNSVEVSPLYLRVSQAEQNIHNAVFSRLTKDDVPSIMAVENQTDSTDLPWSENALSKSFDNPDFECWALKNKDGVLAFVAILNVAGNAEILRVKVAQNARLLGLGERLLRELIANKKAAGCREILLEVNAENFAAIALYKKCGFVEVGRRPKYYHNAVDAILFNLALI